MKLRIRTLYLDKILIFQDSNDLKVFSILSQVRFESSPPDRNPTQMLLDILATADLNVNKNKKEPQPPPTVSEKQSTFFNNKLKFVKSLTFLDQADFFGMVLSNKKSQETDGGDENLQDLDSVEGEDYADRDNYDIYDDEDFDFSDLEESVRPPTTPTPKLAPEADINSRVAVIQDPLTEDEERDLAQLVGSVSFEIFDEDSMFIFLGLLFNILILCF